MTTIKVVKDYNLVDCSTFRTDTIARNYVEVQTEEDVMEVIEYAKQNDLRIHVLSGGSNTIFGGNLEGYLIVKNNIMGIQITDGESTDSESVEVRVGAGENWDGFVSWCCEGWLGGLENLSYIPGSVGAAPVQNIGAYGVELSSAITSVECIDTKSGDKLIIARGDCKFEYRSSIFKTNKSLIITYANFKLHNLKRNLKMNHVLDNNSSYKFKLSYGELAKLNTDAIDIMKVREAVISIRSAKLPDWHKVRNAGSFFNNPIIAIEDYKMLSDKLASQYKISELPCYSYNGTSVKVPAGFLIDKLVNKKQSPDGSVYLWPSQNLVICASPSAELHDIVNYYNYIISEIERITGIVLIPEVNMIGIKQ